MRMSVHHMRIHSVIRLGLPVKKAVVILVFTTHLVFPAGLGCTERSPGALADPQTHPIVIQAQKSLAENRFHDSIALFSDAIRIFPKESSIYLSRGMAHEIVNRDLKAVEDYTEALKVDPKNYQAMENLAGIYERRGDPITEAIRLYKRALELDPRPVWKETLRVWIAMLETRLVPETSTAVGCWNLGNSKATNGKTEEAEFFYSKAIDLNPVFYQAYFCRGLVRLKTGNLSGALADFEQTGRLSPSSRGWLAHRGLVYKRMGHVGKAWEDLQRAVRLDPTDPHALYELAVMLEEKKEIKAASELFQKILSLHPDRNLRKLVQQKSSRGEIPGTPETRGNASESPASFQTDLLW